MGDLAKTLIVVGAVCIAIGLVLLLLQKTGLPGRLPGDLVIKREHFTLSLPIATSIILSIVLSLILYLINKFR